MNVAREQNAAASTSAPSTSASTTAVQARPITSFFRPKQTSSTPATPPATAPAVAPAAAVESTAAAAGTATGGNMVATALAQQPVADSLAAAHTSTAEASARTSQASQQADVARQQPSNPVSIGERSTVTGSVITPLFIAPPTTTRPTPSCGCAEVLLHPVVYHTPFVAPASCTLSPGLHKMPHPHRMPHPVIYFFKPKRLSPGCGFLRSIRYTTAPYVVVAAP